jgi:hypothetical protein
MDSIKAVFESNKRINEVHIMKNGKFVLNAFKCEESGKLFGRLYSKVYQSNNLLQSNKKQVGVPDFEVVRTISREELLNEKEEQQEEEVVEAVRVEYQSKKKKRK